MRHRTLHYFIIAPVIIVVSHLINRPHTNYNMSLHPPNLCDVTSGWDAVVVMLRQL